MGREAGSDQRQANREMVGCSVPLGQDDGVPASEREQNHRRQDRRDTYDRLTLIAVVFACGFTGIAAWFTWDQATLARDQTRRALRAYVVIEAELAAGSEDQRPYVKFTAENMGQTPVYNFFFNVITTLRAPPFEDLPFRELMLIDCNVVSPRQERTFGKTFGKTHVGRLSFSDDEVAGGGTASLFREGKRAAVYGTACYRDIFGQAHPFRFCLEWHAEQQPPQQCSDAHELDTRR